MQRLKKRAEYLAVAKGRRVSRRPFVLQALARSQSSGEPRMGYTVTKKTGNAVARNRIRRRLTEAIRLNGGSFARPGHDYVLIGRRAALTVPFDELTSELEAGFERVHRRQAKSRHTNIRPKSRATTPAGGTGSAGPQEGA